MTNSLVTLHNMRYINIIPPSVKYAQNQERFANATQKPAVKYRTVNQLLQESPLVGSTKFGYNFIA